MKIDSMVEACLVFIYFNFKKLDTNFFTVLGKNGILLRIDTD